MKDRKDFFEKQNSKDMLDILFAQRFYYNRANKLEYFNFVLMLIICISNFFSINNLILKVIIDVVFALISIGLCKWIKADTIKGSNLKKYFDYTLYSFDLDDDFKRKCLGLVHDVINKNKKNYKQQITNDGKARVPGLRDWYFDENYKDEINIIKSMQKQNLYWDKIISKMYVILLFVLFIVLTFLYIIIAYFNKFEILELLIGFIPLFGIMSYLINKFITYFSIDKEMAVANYAIEKATSKNELLEIQKRIDKRRTLNFLPPNLIHKLYSKIIHEKIEYINSKK